MEKPFEMEKVEIEKALSLGAIQEAMGRLPESKREELRVIALTAVNIATNTNRIYGLTLLTEAVKEAIIIDVETRKEPLDPEDILLIYSLARNYYILETGGSKAKCRYIT